MIYLSERTQFKYIFIYQIQKRYISLYKYENRRTQSVNVDMKRTRNNHTQNMQNNRPISGISHLHK